MKRRCYNKSEIDLLVAAYKSAGQGKLNAVEIAKSLGRTTSSVLHKAQRVGVALTGRQTQTWEKHPNWKGYSASIKQARSRARKWFKLDKCELCGNTAYDRHHKDGNPYNNTPANIQSLCRRCHMVSDDRLAKLNALPKTPKKAMTPCRICSQLYKPLRKGRCSRCDMYFRSHGSERPSQPKQETML